METPAEEIARLAAAITADEAARDAAIVRHLLAGAPPVDIARAARLSAERVRQIGRAGGVPPRRTGRPTRS